MKYYSIVPSMNSPLDITLGARLSAYLSTSNDFRKQRKRINKKLLRLRHDLDLVTKDTKNYSSKQKISKISREDYASNDQYGLLLLLTAERDILYSLEIKNLLEISNDRNSSYKNLMISKIKRSLFHCQHLLDISQDETNDIKHLEMYIYSALIQGQLSIVKKQWTKVLTSFSIAKCSLDYLYSKIQGDDEETSFDRTLISELLDNLVDPSLQLAINQDEIHETTTDLKSISRKHCRDTELPYLTPAVHLIERNDKEFLADLSSTVDLIKSISWREHDAALYNDEIAFKIMNLQTITEVNGTNIDELITNWSEVLELHKSDSERNQDEDDLENVQNRAITLTYINYNTIFAKIKRDLLLINDLVKDDINKNKDVIRLFSSIIALVGEARELPGVYNDDELNDSLVNLEKYYESSKQIVLGDLFKFKDQYCQALKIYHHVESNLPIEEDVYQVEFPYNVANNQQYAQFRSDLSEKSLQTRIAAQFQIELGQRNTYAIENVNKYPKSLANIVNLSAVPKIHAILSKPVLFDVAYNYINYDLGKSAAIKPTPAAPIAVEESEESQKKRGFFGIFGGR